MVFCHRLSLKLQVRALGFMCARDAIDSYVCQTGSGLINEEIEEKSQI